MHNNGNYNGNDNGDGDDGGDDSCTCKAAIMRGVYPSLLAMLRSIPLSISSLSTSTLLSATAKDAAVQPLTLWELMSSPFSSAARIPVEGEVEAKVECEVVEISEGVKEKGRNRIEYVKKVSYLWHL